MSRKREKSIKFRTGKIQFDLLPPHAIEMLAMIFDWGTNKYPKHNWIKGNVWSTFIGAGKRHINKFERREDFDDESGLPHVMHAAWQLIVLYEHMRLHKDLDDRLDWGYGHILDKTQYLKRHKIKKIFNRKKKTC